MATSTPDWGPVLPGALRAHAAIDAEALLTQLAAASHVKEPSASWYAKVAALGATPEVLGALLRPFTPDGGARPTDKRMPEARAAWGAAWATLAAPTEANLRIVEAATPWCQRVTGASHQFATVCAMVLGRWPDDAARDALQRFDGDLSLKSLANTLKAGLRRHAQRVKG